MCPKPTTAPSGADRRRGVSAHPRLVAALGVLLLAALWWVFGASSDGTLADWTALVVDRIEPIPPWIYLISFVILPAFGVPILAYYLTIGIVIDGPGWTLLAA